MDITESTGGLTATAHPHRRHQRSRGLILMFVGLPAATIDDAIALVDESRISPPLDQQPHHSRL